MVLKGAEVSVQRGRSAGIIEQRGLQGSAEPRCAGIVEIRFFGKGGFVVAENPTNHPGSQHSPDGTSYRRCGANGSKDCYQNKKNFILALLRFVTEYVYEPGCWLISIAPAARSVFA